MKLGHNSSPFHFKLMFAASTDAELFYDYLILDVYDSHNETSLDDRIIVEVLFIHRVVDTYFQTVETLSAPSIHTIQVFIKKYIDIMKPRAFKDIDICEVREYPTLEHIYLHAIVEYGATSLKVKLKQLGLM